MRKRSESEETEKELRDQLIGLGEASLRKSYYPELQKRLSELERFRAFLDYSNDAIFLVEVPAGRIVDCNDAASRQTGWTGEELLDKSIFDLTDLPRSGQTGALFSEAKSEKGRALIEARMFRRDGARIPTEMTLARMRFEETAYVLAVVRDIKLRKEAEEALAERVRMAELGAEIGVALTRGQGLRDTLQLCAESIIRHTEAAFGRIWVVSKENPELLELKASAGEYCRIDGRHSRKKIGEWKIGKVAAEGKPHLTNSVADDPDIVDQEWVRREGMVSFAGYPLVINDRTLGVVALFSRKPMTEAVLSTLGSVADEIALGIDRHMAEKALWESEMSRLRMETQLELAAQIQSRMLPSVFPPIPGFEVAARCIPAYQVGGDFYDWQETRRGVFSVTLGDVMGKGMGAAMLMATVRASLRATSLVHPPAEALRQAENSLRQDLYDSESFVTLFHAQFDVPNRKLTYVDCGHGLVIMLHADGVIKELLPRGLPLGVLPQTFEEGSVSFSEGDTLVLFSDGLIDAIQHLELDGALSRQFWAHNARDLVDRLVQVVPSSATPDDDMTVVVIKCTGS
ncbi:SpoIIE family protein phosphatase [Geoalkalibacter halelectricus]|uniref:SpoIIE family protein phosphatase n=1 Tax=Geoalkalibacter halelectricus TaxID=2847045 RepID=A0ABY5ZJ68_9BACT|nr:SpoIIE family protein phosphatase [Geoalkalibacter halelectricus]MDO3377301.1 SpoIIE family protein phosphatase [Geoalkalibacter halelectricus]UWZ78939.1 SpoIIE family protein phosphatase [Geoalkalibacter halelectricus]